MRPATISSSSDTDYVKITVPAGTTMTIGTDADGTTLADGLAHPPLQRERRRRIGRRLRPRHVLAPHVHRHVGHDRGHRGLQRVLHGHLQVLHQLHDSPASSGQRHLCAGALSIECGNINVSGLTVNATNDCSPSTTLTGGCTGYYAQGKDVVYVHQRRGQRQPDVVYTERRPTARSTSSRTAVRRPRRA